MRPNTKKLQLRRERLSELTSRELADVKAGQPLGTNLCNCTGTSHMPTQLDCLITLKNCIA